MNRILLYLAAAIVAIHGLVHLMGLIAYWPLGEITELPYKTTLLGGRWAVGAGGIRLFSIFWLVAAAGLIVGAAGLIFAQDWWLSVLGPAVLLSLLICILDWGVAYRGAIISLVILVPLLLAWGLRIQPQPFAAYSETTPVLQTISLPADLPEPVARFYGTIMDGEVPVIDSAVISGRGQLRFAGITFPGRLRFTHDAGRGYRHYIEATIFGYPLMKVNERYLDGQAVMELPVGTVADEPKIDMAANLGLWGESIWLPSIFVTDPRVQWASINDQTARLTVPFADGDDSFTVFFDPDTGLITRMEAMRYREATDQEKILWQLQPLVWESIHGMLIPTTATVTWADEGTPWLIIEVEEVVFNADVAGYIRERGS